MFKNHIKITVALAVLSIIVFLSFQAFVVMKMNNAAEPARQYLSNIIQDFSSWDIKKFGGHLTSDALKGFNSSDGQDLLKLLNSMGKAITINNPSFFGATTEHLTNGGIKRTIEFEVNFVYKSGNVRTLFYVLKTSETYTVDRIVLTSLEKI